MSKYSKEFKEEAIRLSDEIGNKKAAAQLGLPYYTLADWRNKSKHTCRRISVKMLLDLKTLTKYALIKSLRIFR